jgi:hypothetical protein
MAVFFLLLLLIVQIGFLMSARSMVMAAVDGSVRRLSWDAGGAATEKTRITEELMRAVPGIAVESVTIGSTATTVTMRVDVRWTPPGPDLVPITMQVSETRTRVLPP